jgi:Ca-activated chloride channel family protein
VGLENLYNVVAGLSAENGTDIYSPAIEGLDMLKNYDLSKYQPAIVIMTDGQSNTGRKFNDFKAAYDSAKLDVPVFSIMFGAASADQLNELAGYTKGRVFDGKSNLIGAFKSVRGYN